MNVDNYLQVRNETKITNRALGRTNLCVEVLKKRMGREDYDKNELNNKYGKELLLILRNYLIQKYYKKYNLFTDESYKDERLFFYRYFNNEYHGIAGSICMNKGKYYLSEYVKRNGDIFNSIISYGYNGFESIEQQILENCHEDYHIKENENAEITLTLFQLVTIGNCLGYFDMILISDELPYEKQHMMDENKKHKFLIRYKKKLFYIHKFTGQLMLSKDKIIDFKEWCNNDVGNGLNYILSLV